MDRYDPQEIEARWQAVWESEKTWEVPNPGDPGFGEDKPKDYVLVMLPYPSGEPHIGHLKVYSVGDALAHFRRRHGRQVLSPMGYDAFGLPAENNAIKTGQHPRDATYKSIEEFRQQFRKWGVSLDWSRELITSDPSYYRWTQWLFIRFFENGLAYREEAAVQWCPVDQTVLANEQVIDGKCDRCGSPVVAKSLEQWWFKITDYAERLLADFDLLEEWPEYVVTMQRNWIGRSEGGRGHLPLRGARPRLPRLHHPARHALRRHLLRPRARAPRRRPPRRGDRARGRGARVRERGDPLLQRGPRRRGPSRRPACRWGARSPTR